MKTIAVVLCLAAAASAGVLAPATTLVRTPSLDSAVIQSDRVGGNFAYSTVTGQSYAAVSPVVQNVVQPVGVTYSAKQVPVGVAYSAPAAVAAPVAYSQYAAATPVAYSQYAAATPVAYSQYAGATPVAYSQYAAAAPVAYSQYAAGAPLAYSTYGAYPYTSSGVVVA